MKYKGFDYELKENDGKWTFVLTHTKYSEDADTKEDAIRKVQDYIDNNLVSNMEKFKEKVLAYRNKFKKESYEADDKYKNMSYADAKDLLGNRARFELRNMLKALTSMRLINSEEDEKRLAAVKVLLRNTKESLDEIDKITMDVPLLTRMLEYFNENSMDDVKLHKILENLIRESKKGMLGISDYENIIKIDGEEEPIKAEEERYDNISQDKLNEIIKYIEENKNRSNLILKAAIKHYFNEEIDEADILKYKKGVESKTESEKSDVIEVDGQKINVVISGSGNKASSMDDERHFVKVDGKWVIDFTESGDAEELSKNNSLKLTRIFIDFSHENKGKEVTYELLEELYKKIVNELDKGKTEEKLQESIIILKTPWNMPETIKKIQDITKEYDAVFSNGKIYVDETRTKLNELLGKLKAMSLNYDLSEGLKESLKESDYQSGTIDYKGKRIPVLMTFDTKYAKDRDHNEYERDEHSSEWKMIPKQIGQLSDEEKDKLAKYKKQYDKAIEIGNKDLANELSKYINEYQKRESLQEKVCKEALVDELRKYALVDKKGFVIKIPEDGIWVKKINDYLKQNPDKHPSKRESLQESWKEISKNEWELRTKGGSKIIDGIHITKTVNGDWTFGSYYRLVPKEYQYVKGKLKTEEDARKLAQKYMQDFPNGLQKKKESVIVIFNRSVDKDKVRDFKRDADKALGYNFIENDNEPYLFTFNDMDENIVKGLLKRNNLQRGDFQIKTKVNTYEKLKQLKEKLKNN